LHLREELTGEKGDNSDEAMLLLHEIWETFEEVSEFSVGVNKKERALRKKLLAQLTDPEPSSPTNESGFEESRLRNRKEQEHAPSWFTYLRILWLSWYRTGERRGGGS
jgi:hypothetical protein